MHVLVDIQIRCGRGIEACEELIHDDEEFQLAGFLDEPRLRLLLELLDLVHGRFGRFIEPLGEHFPVDIKLPQPLREAFTALLALNLRGDWLV